MIPKTVKMATKIDFMRVLGLIGFVLIVACKRERVNVPQVSTESKILYNFKNTSIAYKEKTELVFRLKAPLERKYLNQNIDYPQGIEVDVYQKGRLTTTIEADSAHYDDEKSLYRAFKNVVVRNTVKKQSLETDTLAWEPKRFEIRSNGKVKITTTNEIIYGLGLTARQDFSSYRIHRPTGIIGISER